MTNFKHLFTATSCLLLASSCSAFVLPQRSISSIHGVSLSMSAAPPRGDAYRSMADAQQQQRDNMRRQGPPGPPPREENYRPKTKFDQNDPFINTPYGQANDINRPMGAQQRVTYARANVDDWKRETSRQDAFINGAYGSAGVGRYGLDMVNAGRPSSARSYNSNQYIDPKARAQEDFINNPYGNKSAPGRPGFENPDRGVGYERYQKQRPPMGQNGPRLERYTRDDPRRRQSVLEEKFERYRKQPPHMAEGGAPRFERYRPEPRGRPNEHQAFMDSHNGSNRMEPRGGPPPGSKRLERYDPRDERIYQDRSQDEFLDSHAGSNRMQYQEPSRYERFDPRQDPRQRYAQENNLIEKSPGKRMQNSFDPRRYESRPIRSPEQRDFGRRDGHRMPPQQDSYNRNTAAQDFIDNPNGSSYRPGQYGYGNDGDDQQQQRSRHASYNGGW